MTQHLEKPVPGPEDPVPECTSAFPPCEWGVGEGVGEHRLQDHQDGLQPSPDLPHHVRVFWDYFFSCTMEMTIFLFWTVDYWMIMWNKEKLQKWGDHIYWDGKELSPGQGVHLDGQEEFIKQKEGRFSRRCTIIKSIFALATGLACLVTQYT